MSGRRKKEPSFTRQLLQERGIKDLQGIQDLVKELTKDLIQDALDAELEEDLGYSKYDYRTKSTDNSRNGYSKKTLNSSQGEIEIEVPRDRNAEFEPQLVKKHQTDISAIEDKIIFLYSQGTSTRDIEKTMREMYGIEVDDTRVSKITDKLLPMITEWQNRPLKDVYAMFMLWSCWMLSITRCVRMELWQKKLHMSPLVLYCTHLRIVKAKRVFYKVIGDFYAAKKLGSEVESTDSIRRLTWQVIVRDM